MENKGQKRSLEGTQTALEGVTAVLLSVEGTSSPSTFAKDKLVPYVKENLKTYIENHFDEDECQKDIQALREEESAGIPAKDADKEAVVSAVVKFIEGQLEGSTSAASAQALPGRVLREAFKTGALLGEVYKDVSSALKAWFEDDKQLYSLSEESADTQRLLFGYSNQGNLSEFFANHFDSTVGTKTDKETYTKITTQIGCAAKEILFLSDSLEETKCASEAGLQTRLVVRDGSAPEEEDVQIVSSLTELCGSADDEVPAKKLATGNGEAEGDNSDDDDVEEIDDEDDDDLEGEDIDDEGEEGDAA